MVKPLRPKIKLPPAIDCNAETLAENLQKAIGCDADEVTLRISQYDSELNPVQWQAIVRFSDRTRAWAVAVGLDPYKTLCEAVTQAAEMRGPTAKERVTKTPTRKPDAQDVPRLLPNTIKRRVIRTSGKR